MIKTIPKEAQIFTDKGKITERLLQLLWKQNQFNNEYLTTASGEPLQILFPGWFNNHWGPDFKEARIKIDQTEFFGDIEIHINESSWFHHGHRDDPNYNRVILHVFLFEAEIPAINQFNFKIPSLFLGSPNLVETWKNLNIPKNLSIEELPGICGLILSNKTYNRFNKILLESAENRLISKAKIFEISLNKESAEQIENQLFTSICKSLGYSAFNNQLVALSERYPYSCLKTFFSRLYRQSRVEILSRWFGFLGIFENKDDHNQNDEVRRDWLMLKQKWDQIGEKETLTPPLPKKSFRPLNSPIRRLIGLYYHLESTHFKGLLKSWLWFFENCKKNLKENKKCQKQLLSGLEKMFPEPSWESFLNHNSTIKSKNLGKKTRLIGKNKQLVILVNTIIPFFLAWSRKENNTALEKLLYKLLLILPNEGKNKKTIFMENRLFTNKSEFKLKRNLIYHQGLIQIHDDCCTNFYEGCRNCSLVKWLCQ